MAYEGMLLSSANPSIRVMLIGTRVPPNVQRSLDHHGIAWKEIRPAELVAFLRSKGDLDLMRVFEQAAAPALAEFGNRQPHQSARETVYVVPRRTIQGSDASHRSPFDEDLGKCESSTAYQFFENALRGGQGRTEYALRYEDADGRVRWYVNPRAFGAYVVQKGRFAGDEVFWNAQLSQPVKPKRKPDGNADLSFQLVTPQDFEFFQQTAQKELKASALNWEISRRRR
jgi:hypothetical protein